MTVRAAHPLPDPAREGEGVVRWIRLDRATGTERHLPPCGGGWEGGV